MLSSYRVAIALMQRPNWILNGEPKILAVVVK
jgi:hypothetical protein